MSDGSYRVSSTFFVTISFILQILSIVSPGWLVDIHQNVERYDSVFYRLTCTTKISTKCHAKSYYTMYKEKRQHFDKISPSKLTYLSHDKEVYDDVQDMVMILVALFCTFLIFIAQMKRTCNRDKRYLRLITVSPACLTFAAALMLSLVSREVVYNYHMYEVRLIDDNVDHTYIGFPYSLTMYGVAALFALIAALIQINQMIGPLKKPVKKKMSDDYEVIVPAQKKLPVSQTTTVKESTLSTIDENTFDNPAFSVKL